MTELWKMTDFYLSRCVPGKSLSADGRTALDQLINETRKRMQLSRRVSEHLAKLLGRSVEMRAKEHG